MIIGLGDLGDDSGHVDSLNMRFTIIVIFLGHCLFLSLTNKVIYVVNGWAHNFNNTTGLDLYGCMLIFLFLLHSVF